MISFRSALYFLISLSFCSCHPERGQNKVNAKFKHEIETFMLEFIEATNVPGMGLAYYSDSVGNVLSALGQSDVENKQPLEISTYYPIQSTTKLMLAIVTLQLIEEKEFTLGSSIAQWFAGFPNGENVTIRHLLQHTSGYNNYQDNTEFNEEYYSNTSKEYRRNDLIDAGLAMPYEYKDFGRHKYSNTNSLILAEIIESTTKQTIGQEFRQRIFEPARMSRTYYKPEWPNDTNQIIKCYQDGMAIDLERINFKSNAAGGVISTIDDMMKFAHWILDNEWYRPMTSSLVNNVAIDGHEFKYGLGMEVITNMYGTSLYGHAGGNPGFIHEFYFSTETKEIIIFYFNKWPDEVEFQFRERLGAILKRYRGI